jgi:hypothetical protein
MDNSALDIAVIKECILKHPEAENEIVAVDLEAQEQYKALQKVFGKEPMEKVQLKISSYNYLRDLRNHLNDIHLQNLSSFIIKN